MKTKRSAMPAAQRAKQFLPFAALSGLEEALEAQEKILLQASQPERVENPEYCEWEERECEEKSIYFETE